MSTKAPKFGKYTAAAKTDDTPVDVEIHDRDGVPYVRKDGKPVVFQVVGEYSEVYRKGERRLIDKALIRARKHIEIDAEDVEEGGLEKIANGVVGWNLDDEDGKDVPFSAANVVAFLTEVPWVEKEITQAIKGHARFFKRGSAI